MHNAFSDAMSRQTDAELLRIVQEERASYQPEAVQAAEHEIEQRGLSYSYKETLQKENSIQQQAKEQKALAPLETKWKLCILLFPGIGFVTLALSGLVETRGYTRKASEMRRWILYCWLLYGCLFVLPRLFL